MSEPNDSYSFANKVARIIWKAACLLLFRWSPRPLHAWRTFLLRRFGAEIGTDCHIYGGARIWAPWNLICDSRACIADEAEIYNPARVVLGERSVVSQGAFLCTASHDYRDEKFPLIHQPIVVERGVWIAARAIVLMGVTIGENSVIGAGSVVTESVPPNVVCAGNPARIIKQK